MAVRTVTAAHVARMKKLRGEGLSATAIGSQLGLSDSTVRNWWNAGECVDCGAPTERSSGQAAKRCETCMRIWVGSDEGRAARTIWTSERILAAIVWWASEHGEPPALMDFSPSHCFDRGDAARGHRAALLIAQERIPWFTNVIRRFGTWNAAISAAGFEPRLGRGSSVNQLRTRNARRARELEAASPAGRAD